MAFCYIVFEKYKLDISCEFYFQSETGTIQRGYNDLTELIADYIKRGDQNGLAGALIHPIPVEGITEELESGTDWFSFVISDLIPVASKYLIIILGFLVSPLKHILWVLIRNASVRHLGTSNEN